MTTLDNLFVYFHLTKRYIKNIFLKNPIQQTNCWNSTCPA